MSENADEFEYEWPSDDGQEQEGDQNEIEIQNMFYEADDNKKSKPQEALEQFENVVLMEEQTGGEVKFRFKALENIVILSGQLGHYDNMINKQKQLLKLIDKVTKNDVSEAINNVLDAVSSHLNHQPDYQRQMYQMTLSILKTNNERLWFNLCLRLGNIYLDQGYYEELDKILTELKDNCRAPGDSHNFDQSKGNELLKVFALEIQMCTATKNSKRMKAVYPQTTNLNAVINDPRVVGIIKECGGKMFMSEKKWEKALEELFESFKSYQESGNPRAKAVLKYVILASMLSGSSINYSGTREAKVYMDDEEIMAIMSLRTAFENNDINLIQQILGDRKNQILDDPFIAQYLDDLLRNIRLNVLVARVKPYRSVSLEYLAKQLDVSRDEIRSLLSELILEEKISGEIDQVNGFLELQASNQKGSEKHRAMKNWAQALYRIHTQLMQKVPN